MHRMHAWTTCLLQVHPKAKEQEHGASCHRTRWGCPIARQMMKKGQASMALEEDQIEQAMSLNHDAYPTRRALWMDERRRPIGARVRVGRNCRSSCCRNHPLSFFLSLAGGGRRCPARQPAPTAKQGQDASDAHYRWCAGDDGARRAGGGSRPRQASRGAGREVLCAM